MKCPIGQLNWELLGDALEAYELLDSGFLPEAGSIYDQTEFFFEASRLVKRKIKAKEVEEIKNASKKNK